MLRSEADVEIFRRQIQRILASSEFAQSRQLRDYLTFVGEAAFQGRTQIDQIEVAEQVLHRKDFNPVDDASARKLATLLRQRLDHYYSGEGAADEIRVVLPTRSYIPIFDVVRHPELDPAPAPAPQQQPVPTLEIAVQPPAVRTTRPSVGRLALLGIAAAIVLAGVGILRLRSVPAAAPQFVFQTEGGDIMHRENNAKPSAIRIGPAVSLWDQVTVRMKFLAERATQQAGLLIFRNADEYIKLGRQFNSRPQMEFGVETGGTYRKPVGTFVYDASGQNGEPVWLSIRRNRSNFTAWISSDGASWNKFGNDLELADAAEARVALFAYNGRADAPSTNAVFDQLSVGTEFFGTDPRASISESLAGWRIVSDADSPSPYLDAASLVFPFSATEKAYAMQLLQLVPAGDWTVTTKLDFLSVNGVSAGLSFRGNRSHFRLIRWDLDGGSITAEHLGHRQANRRDFEGSPPVILKVRCEDGVLLSSFSRDGVTFQDLPLRVPIAMLGDKVEFGLEASKSTWSSGLDLPPARFAYFRRELQRLANYK